MEKIFCLPKITLKDMQNRVKQQRTTHKKYNYEQIYAENTKNHHHDIKITSPFYERTHHKEKCECRYHRLKREMQANKKINLNKQTIYEEMPRALENRQSKGDKVFIELTNRISNAKLTSPSKTLQPLQNTLPIRIELQNEGIQEANSHIFEPHSKSFKKLPTRKTFKSLKCKPILEVMDEVANSRVDDLNREYILMISRRLQNEKFKQKYIKTLFGFIKMKSNRNKLYISSSKAYIKNSLNMLLNHYSMDKLLDVSKLSKEEINQIAYYMNCFPDKVKNILLDLGRTVSQMEKALAQMKKNRNYRDELQKKASTVNLSNFEDGYKNDEQLKNKEAFNSLDQYNYRNTTTKDSYLAEADQNNTSIANIEPHWQASSLEKDEELQKANRKQKYSILRTSCRKLNDFISNSQQKKENNDKQLHLNQQSNIRKSIRNSMKNQQLMNRSLRSTVLGIVDEIQKETHFPKKKQTAKMKKGQLKTKLADFDEKYLNIQYEKYLTKKHFQNLIGQIERLDQNDTERAQTIFKELNVQSFLDNYEKIQEIVKTFKPLFNQKSLHFFLRQIVMVRDKRYIQKLQRQLDDMLQEIKKNDPRTQVLDFFQIKPEKKVPSYMNKMVKCREFKVEKEQTINHIKYFQAEEQIQRHRTKEQSVKMHLQQVPLLGIRFDTIDPVKSAVITHFQSPKRQLRYQRSSNLPDISDQKKILRYMKQKHQGTFNYLAQQFETLCKSLSNDCLA